MNREQKLEILLLACTRMVMKVDHYKAKVPSMLEADIDNISELVAELTEVNLKQIPDEDIKVEGDLA